MPYKRKRKLRKVAKRPKRSGYRTAIPRTIQIATRRNYNQTLRFVINQSYVYDGTKTPNGKTAFLNYRANSIFHSQLPNSLNVGEWKSQEPSVYDNLAATALTPNATGWDQWTERYQHFCVVGAKMTYTFEPITTGVPAILCSHLSGVSGALNTNTTSAQINKLPFTYRHSLASNGVFQSSSSSPGVRGNCLYSAKKFEGVKDVIDNSNLRGRFANPLLTPPQTGNPPSEQTYFYLSMSPVDPNSTGNMPSGVFRVKVEYITMLKEPTDSNLVQLQVTNTATSDDREL